MNGPRTGDSPQRWAELVAAVRGRAGHDPSALLDTAVGLGLDVGDGVVACSITQSHGAGWRTPNASGAVAVRLDTAQYSAGTGPCITAASTGTVVRLAPVDEAPQSYATFVAAAAEHAVAASLSVPVPSTRAAVNLYAATASTFDGRRPKRVAELLARVCAVLLNDPESTPSATTPLADAAAESAARRDAATVQDAVRIVQRTGNLSRARAHDWVISRAVDQGRSVAAVAHELVEASRRRGPGRA